MKPEADRLKEVFAQALQRKTVAEREEYLAEACQGYAELRRQVDSLLRAHEQAGDFLEQTIQLPSADFEPEPIGSLIGRYKLLERIGEGGFGVVYMAEQQEPVQRKVALKIIKAGMDTREVIARFEAERQALALMDHPNIAKVLDAGTTEAKRPYFVMELVRGIPITDYCDQAKLSTTERLELFIKVCQAVQHAHQKAVIHRDLKPSNILVTLHDGEPVPKVIDFGVAKALGQKLTEKTLFTAFRQMIGTPAYMSPEQAEMSGLDIDTRSDIYSLGVLLYELLTGVTPFDKKVLAKAALDEIRRMIRETEPPKPSTRLQTLGEKLIEVAKSRRSDPNGLTRLVRGDLDWIVMKCLEKDRQRRYDAANSLAADLERHINYEPVIACPPSALYRLGKTVRRHKLAFAAGTAIASSVIIGLTLSTVLFLRERAARQISVQEKQRADEQVATASAIEEFLEKDLLAHAAPDSDFQEKPEPDLRVRTLLDRASDKIEGQFTNKPLVEAGLRLTLGQAYHQLGAYPTQERHLRRALDLYRRILGETNALTLRAAAGLGDAERHLGHSADGVLLLREALEREKQSLGPHHEQTLWTMNQLAAAYVEIGETNRGLALLAEAVGLAAVKPGAGNEITAELMNNLCGLLAFAGNFIESETKYKQVLDLRRKLYGIESPRVVTSLSMLAAIQVRLGKAEEAERSAHEAINLLEKHPGSESLELAVAMGNLGAFLAERGRYSEAEPILRRLLAMRLKLLGETNLDVAISLESLADTLAFQRKILEAEDKFRLAFEIRKQLQGAQHPETSNVVLRWGYWLNRLGRSADAEGLLREALGSFPPSSKAGTNAFGLTYGLGAALFWEGKLAESECVFRDALSIQQLRRPANDADIARVMATLSVVLFQEDKLTEAESLARDSITILKARLGASAPQVLRLESLLLGVARKQGRLADAEAVLWQNWQFMALAGLGHEIENEPDWLEFEPVSHFERGFYPLKQESLRYNPLSPEQALKDLTAAIQSPLANQNPDVCRLARSALYGRLGRFGEAAEDLQECAKHDRDLLALPLVALWMDSEHTTGYDDYRRSLLVRYSRLQPARTESDEDGRIRAIASTRDQATAASAALSLLIYPETARYESACRLANFAISHGDRHPGLAHFQMVKGLAEYRLGHFGIAAGWSEKSVAAKNSDLRTVVAGSAVLAMARTKLGDTNGALQSLAQARTILDSSQSSREIPNSDLGENWAEWLTVKLLVKEAAASLATTGEIKGNNQVGLSPTNQANARIRQLAATVNDAPIFQDDVQELIRPQEESLRRQYLPDQEREFQKRLEQVRDQCLEELIARELIFADTIASGGDVPERHVDDYIEQLIRTNYYGDSNVFAAVLAKKEITVRDVRQQFRRSLLIAAARQKRIEAVISPTGEQIEEHYRAHQTNFWQEESTHIFLIVINTTSTNQGTTLDSRRRLAEQVRARIVAGADFAQEANLQCEASGPRNGGDRRWVQRGMLRAELDGPAFSMRQGEVSPVIETKEAFYILRVGDRRPGTVKPLDEVREEIGKNILQTRRVAAEKAWIANLRSNAVVLRPPFQ